jgi:hypothetical protein
MLAVTCCSVTTPLSTQHTQRHMMQQRHRKSSCPPAAPPTAAVASALGQCRKGSRVYTGAPFPPEVLHSVNTL